MQISRIIREMICETHTADRRYERKGFHPRRFQTVPRSASDRAQSHDERESQDFTL